MTTSEIPVFFSVDDRYAPFLSVALLSAVRNADPARRYRAIILYEQLNDAHRAQLQSLSAPHFQVELVPLQEGLECITDTIENRLRYDYFTLTIYFRLLIPRMFPQYDKAIYIDSDVVIPGDLAALYEQPLGDCLIGGCADSSVADVPVLTAYMENAVGVPAAEYINSGVLLMNLKALREAAFDRHFLHLLQTYKFDSLAPDQDYINAICSRRILYLDAAWNAMPNQNRPPLADPKLIHFNLFSKPWCYDGLPYADCFWRYAAESPCYEEILAIKSAFGEEGRKTDEERLRVLLERGESIPRQPVTFRKAAESGVKIRL